jgi:ribonucleotide reductase alpha subunit
MNNIVHGITVDYSRDSLFDELGLKRLKESYMREDEVSPQERFAYVSKAFGTNELHAQRFYEYSSKHWLYYSTPVLSVAFLYHVSYLISMIVRKVWSIVSLK